LVEQNELLAVYVFYVCCGFILMYINDRGKLLDEKFSPQVKHYVFCKGVLENDEKGSKISQVAEID